MLKFLKKRQTVFNSDCMILHSNQQCTRVSISPHRHQRLSSFAANFNRTRRREVLSRFHFYLHLLYLHDKWTLLLTDNVSLCLNSFWLILSNIVQPPPLSFGYYKYRTSFSTFLLPIYLCLWTSSESLWPWLAWLRWLSIMSQSESETGCSQEESPK